MAEPPFSGLEGSLGGARRRGAGIGRYFRRSGAPGVFSEFRTTGSVFGVQDHRECFRSSGVSGRKMCCGAPETLRSEEGFEAGGTREEKYAVVPRKLRRAGHQQENYMQIPQKAVKWV